MGASAKLGCGETGAEARVRGEEGSQQAMDMLELGVLELRGEGRGSLSWGVAWGSSHHQGREAGL